MGGLAGQTEFGGTVGQSYATGAVTGLGNVGGLVGSNAGPVSQSYATGAVTGSSVVGGLIGSNNFGGMVSHSYSSGAVAGSTYVGGLVGVNDSTVSQSYWDRDTSGQSNGVGINFDNFAAIGLTTSQARNAADYAGFDFATVWYQAGDLRPILRSEAATADANGVIAVSNLHQLQLVGANLGGNYRLSNNIDASPTSGTNAAGVFGTGGFVPIGDNLTSFTGNLDGAGHVVSNLLINRPTTDFIGLVGYLTGQIRGIGITGGNITGRSVVGGLVGYNSGGTVIQSYTTSAANGSGFVGGLVGDNGGTISQSYATEAVTGSDNYVGGLVGFISNGGTVSQSYASGVVTGRTVVGGLVGGSNGLVSQSYATGTVTGSSNIGGLVGFNQSTVTQSYATGAVTGSISVGGLVGNNNSTISQSYWDMDTSGQSNGFGANSGNFTAIGLTTAQVRNAANYAGFDFTNVWYQAGDLRPILRSEAATADANGVIAVSNLHQLQLIGANLAGSYRLTNDIDASPTSGANAAGIFGTGGFVPIGNNTARFIGTLDGARHVVSDLVINRPTTIHVGLIGYLSGTITGIGITGGSISGDYAVGGLVGFMDGGTISQSYATVAVNGSRYHVGGLVGLINHGTVSQSYATGAVTGLSFTGGLVGYNSGTVFQSYATGAVIGSTDSVGGLVGINYGTVSQSYAAGAVTSPGSATGGLVGENFFGTVSQSFWDMNTTGQSLGVGIDNSSSSATGLTTAQMQDVSTFRTIFAGFDFDSVWAPPSDAALGKAGGIGAQREATVGEAGTRATPITGQIFGAGSEGRTGQNQDGGACDRHGGCRRLAEP